MSSVIDHNDHSCPQISELEADFERLPTQKPQQQRFLRSQQDLRAKVEAQGAAADGGGGGDGGEAEEDADEVDTEMDPYELMEPVEILSKMPKQYYEQIVSDIL